MIFKNDPFARVDTAFRKLYPDKMYVALITPELKLWKREYGCTSFDTEPPTILISSKIRIDKAVNIFAHELAHVAVGIEVGHGKEWEQALDAIYVEYHREAE
jgi:hypothetical protein